MKYLIIALINIIPLLGSAASYAPVPVQTGGSWYSQQYDLHLIIKPRRHHLKVRGLRSRGRWSKFQRLSASEWMDRHGNSIVLTRSQKIRYIDRRRRRAIHLDRANWSSLTPYNRYDYASPQGREASADRYYVRELDEYVQIQQTATGLRARRVGGKWITYRQHQWKPTESVDANGNVYRRLPGGDLKWFSRDGLVSYSLSRR